MKRMQPIILLLILILCHGNGGVWAQKGKILTYFDGTTIHLRWTAKTDPAIEGYHIMRQVENSEEWVMLTPNPVTMIFDQNQIRRRAGYRGSLYLQLLGMSDTVSRLTPDQFTRIYSDPEALNLFEAMSMINPVFGELRGLVYHDSLAPRGRKIRYQVEVLSRGITENWAISDWIETVDPDKIPDISGLAVSGQDGKILLTWEKQTDALLKGEVVTYQIYRSDHLLGPYQPMNVYGILPVRQKPENPENNQLEQYLDNYLENGKTYYYYVTAVNPFGQESRRSVTLEVTVGSDLQPAPPHHLNYQILGKTVQIKWISPVEAVDGYRLYRSEDSLHFELVWPPSEAVKSTKTSYLEYQIKSGSSYWYYLQSVKKKIISEPSDTLLVHLPDVESPPAPINLTASIQNKGILLSWDPVTAEDILGYEIERSIDPDFSTNFLLNAFLLPDPEYFDSLPSYSQETYYYRVFASDSSYNRSSSSVLVKARMPDIVPPQAPFVIGLAQTQSEVLLEWTQSADPEIMQYRIYASATDSIWVQVATVTETRSTFSLSDPGVYKVAVTAVDQAGNESPKSTAQILTYSDRQFPDPPPKFKAKKTREDYIQLTWKSSPSKQINGYRISRSTGSSENYLDVAKLPAGSTEWIDRKVRNGIQYRYRIQTINEKFMMSKAKTVQLQIR